MLELKNNENARTQRRNHENHEILIIPIQNHENNKIHRIPQRNPETHDYLIIPLQN